LAKAKNYIQATAKVLCPNDLPITVILREAKNLALEPGDSSSLSLL